MCLFLGDNVNVQLIPGIGNVNSGPPYWGVAPALPHHYSPASRQAKQSTPAGCCRWEEISTAQCWGMSCAHDKRAKTTPGAVRCGTSFLSYHTIRLFEAPMLL